jgi:hypothetical protein
MCTTWHRRDGVYGASVNPCNGMAQLSHLLHLDSSVGTHDSTLSRQAS